VRLCVASLREPSVSETFIRSHIERLSEDVTAIHSYHSWPYRSYGLFPVVDGGSRFVPRSHELALRVGHHLPRRVEAALRRPAEASLGRFLDERSIELVLAEYGISGVEVMTACEERNVPLITHFHGYDAYQADLVADYTARYESLFEISERIVAGSRHMANQLERLGAPPRKVCYCPVGADTDLFDGADPVASAPTFLAVGRLIEKKAPHLTISAFAKAARQVPEARLTMIGRGPLRARCEHVIAKEHLGGRVTMAGAKTHAEVADTMRGVRAVVQHSVTAPNGDSEGTALSVIEAGAAGLPVVATRHGGIVESVIDGETGFLVDPGDVDGMASRMTELATSPDLAARLGRAAHQRVREHFSLTRSAERLRALCRDCARA
jgi:colanic acid/amylovoran biosynthesis glycosyltransferase